MILALVLALCVQQPSTLQPQSLAPKAQTQQAQQQQQAPAQLQQALPPSGTPPAASEPEPPKVQPWQGTLSAGRTELQKLSNAGEHDQAIALAARVLAMSDWDRQPEEARADALFDIGVALGVAKAAEPAAETFHKARGLAGSKPLGLDALYDAGTFRLQSAEELRLQIPEIREKLKLPPLPKAQPAPQQNAPLSTQPSQGEQAPDALAQARAAYVAARGDLVERLRCEATDRDTRANLELIQRRLRELDELEKQRQEEQEKKDQEQKDEQKKDQQNQKDKQQGDQQDQQKQDQENQDQQKQDQQQQDEKQDQQQQDQQQPNQDEQKQDEKDQKAQPDPKDQKEIQLSPEEVVRLLDQLQKIEEQAEQVRAQLRERRRVPVKKDW